MGRQYTSAVEAIAAGSCCNIQLEFALPPIPAPTAPILQLPDLPSLPSISFHCPCDAEDEEPLE
jgi:hypothetical protein